MVQSEKEQLNLDYANFKAEAAAEKGRVENELKCKIDKLNGELD